MEAIDLEGMTDDEISDIQYLINAEKNRRKNEAKFPVYCFDGKSMKSLPGALKDLKRDIDSALNYPGGAEKYFDSAINDEIKADLFSLKIEFWSKSEYDARPDTVWG